MSSTTVGYAYLPDYDYSQESTGSNYLSNTSGSGIQLVLQLTTLGVALLEVAKEPPVLAYYSIGDGYGYVPQESQTTLKGTVLLQGTPSDPVVDTGNFLIYSINLAASLGPISYGEIGLFDSSNNLIAIAVASDPIHKNPNTVTGGGVQQIDLYIPMAGEVFEGWAAYADQPNEMRISVVQQLDSLPQGRGAATNAYVVVGAASDQASFLAYTDRLGLWMFDAYQFGNQVSAKVTARTAQTISIAIGDWNTELNPTYKGKVILQFADGPLMGVCRYLETATTSADGLSKNLGLSATVTTLPDVGDTVQFLVRDPLSINSIDLPVATATSLGGIQVGTTLTITEQGLLNVRQETLPVISVNGYTGEVVLVASDISGLATVATSGKYSDLTGKPAAYALPVATTTVLGGVKIGTSGNLTMTSGVLDFNGTPVKSVNSLVPDSAGNVVVPDPAGLVGAKDAGTDLNLVVTQGLYYATASTTANLPSTSTTDGTLEVTPLPDGALLQVWLDGSRTYQRTRTSLGAWSAWVQSSVDADIGFATQTSVGLVSIGSGINVTPTGQISLSLGVPGGIATLDTSGKVTSSQLPDSVTGAMTYQGVWDPQTNTPTLASGVGTKGYYYKVAAASSDSATTTLDGNSTWKVGDIVAFNGYMWDRIASSPDSVSSVAGRIGDVVLTVDDISGLSTAAKTGNFYDMTYRPYDISTWNNDVGYLTHNEDITISGDVVAVTSKTTFDLQLAASGVAAGQYTKVTVNAKGLVTQGSALASADVVAALGYTPYNATNPSAFITASQAPVQSVFGRTGAVVLASSDVVTALGYTPVNKAGDTVSGVLTIAGTNVPLYVNSTNSYVLKIGLMDAGTARGYIGADRSYCARFFGSSGGATAYLDNSGNFTAAGDVTAYSDMKLKTNIKPIENALQAVEALRGVTWDWIKSGSPGIGVIAQEVEAVVPQVVHSGEDGTLSVAYGNLVGILIEAVKELSAKVKVLEARSA